MGKKVIKILVALLIVALGVGVWIWNTSARQSGKVRFVTTTVARGDFVNKVQATGTLEPQELVDVGAQVTGEIKEFGTDVNGKRIDYGSEVKSGQLLARIDDTLVELDITRAQAAVAQAEAQILTAEAAVAQAGANEAQAQANKNKADRDMARAKVLGVGDALSQMEYDQYINAAESTAAALQSAQAQIQTAKAQQASAAAQLQSAQAQLARELRNRDYTRITTPVDGTIVVRQVNVGQTVVSSMNATTLFLVARDLTRMQIWASVNEADIAKVHPGQEVRYTVDALPNETFTGKVNKIRPNATMASNVVTYIVEVDVENPERKLLPYMSANVNFIVEEFKDCLMVADAAFDYRPPPTLIQPGTKPQRPGEAEAKDATLLWKRAGDYVVSVRVVRGRDDGTRSVVTPAEGETLEAGDELVTRVVPGEEEQEASPQSGKNLFGMNRPKRRERSTGGAEPKPGQDAKGGGHHGPPPPPM